MGDRAAPSRLAHRRHERPVLGRLEWPAAHPPDQNRGVGTAWHASDADGIRPPDRHVQANLPSHASTLGPGEPPSNGHAPMEVALVRRLETVYVSVAARRMEYRYPFRGRLMRVGRFVAMLSHVKFWGGRDRYLFSTKPRRPGAARR